MALLLVKCYFSMLILLNGEMLTEELMMWVLELFGGLSHTQPANQAQRCTQRESMTRHDVAQSHP